MIEIYNSDVLEFYTKKKIPLIIADPPYGNVVKDYWDRWGKESDLISWMLDWTNYVSSFQNDGDVMYVWGGIGSHQFRPFYKYMTQLEHETDYVIKNQITWSKRRAYGVKDNYLFTREECLYLVKNAKSPNIFNIPLMDELRGYEGYNKKYPAKSPYKRRTNVWTDVPELFSGKVHIAQKPEKLADIMIETHTNVGDLVMDPFAGSGSTGFSARRLGRDCILIEKDKDIFESLKSRLMI